MRRVVVTGLGAVSPLGLDARQTWRGLLEGKSGIARVTRFDISAYPSQIAGEVKNFEIDRWIAKKEQKKMDPFIHYAMAAGKMAVEDSGLDITQTDPTKVGVIVSAGMGGLPGIEAQYDVLKAKGPTRV